MARTKELTEKQLEALAKKPRFARNDWQKLLAKHGTVLINKIVDLATDGNEPMLKLCVDRLLPSIKPRDGLIIIPKIDKMKSNIEKSNYIVKLVAEGSITPEEANKVMSLLTSILKIEEVEQIKSRIEELEKHANN